MNSPFFLIHRRWFLVDFIHQLLVLLVHQTIAHVIYSLLHSHQQRLVNNRGIHHSILQPLIENVLYQVLQSLLLHHRQCAHFYQQLLMNVFPIQHQIIIRLPKRFIHQSKFLMSNVMIDQQMKILLNMIYSRLEIKWFVSLELFLKYIYIKKKVCFFVIYAFRYDTSNCIANFSGTILSSRRTWPATFSRKNVAPPLATGPSVYLTDTIAASGVTTRWTGVSSAHPRNFFSLLLNVIVIFSNDFCSRKHNLYLVFDQWQSRGKKKNNFALSASPMYRVT